MSDTWILLLQGMLGYAVPFKQKNKGGVKILLLEKRVLRERVEGWEVENTILKAVFPELLVLLDGSLLVCLKALSLVGEESIHCLNIQCAQCGA